MFYSVTFFYCVNRFHMLQEFDEGKRSCRRRLAGHNKRRRKTNQDAAPSGSSLSNDQTSSYLLISLLKILSNMHCKYLFNLIYVIESRIDFIFV